MGKITYKVKNAFKSKEQRDIEARMEFNRNKRAFTKYYQELDASIGSFSKMAKDAEMSGNHENARSCAMFVLKLQKAQVKVQKLLQRFEMMHAMSKMGTIMSDFVDACARMGYSLDSAINFKTMVKNTAEIGSALGKLDAMTDQMDMVFDLIDEGMSGDRDVTAYQDEEFEAEADQLLDQIMGRHNAVNYNQPETPAARQEAQPSAAAEDDTDARLRRLMEELKG